MNIALDIFYCVTAVIALTSMGLEFRRCLTMLQQNSYINSRYRTWLDQSHDSTSALRLLSIAVVLMSLAVTLTTMPWAMLLVLVMTTLNGWHTARLRYKKPLVMTRRAWRIATVMSVIALIFIVGLWGHFSEWETSRRDMFIIAITALGLFCASHLVAMAAIWILGPIEKRINRKYRRQAEDILRSMPNLKIVGITGSYGKTSTKHFLHRILSEKYDTLMTPGNFNTTLGVIRTVREYLKPYNEVFIVEMGAKNIGDIKDICDLVNPSIGIVTAIGPQHLETFKTIENVQRTKFEIIDALPADGLAVINDDFKHIADRRVDNVDSCRYAVSKPQHGDWTVTDITIDSHGTDFTLNSPDGKWQHHFHTRLLGEANISDLAAAIITATKMGVNDDKIAYAVSQIEPVEHRLSIKRTPGGVTIIDDAYNSNPVGSAMAMDVLRLIDAKGKRIVVTPGMVELGIEQDSLNEELGDKIAKAADMVIVVNQLNRDALIRGLEKGGMQAAAIHKADTFAEAQQILATILQTGDIVLYENDLPDTFK